MAISTISRLRTAAGSREIVIDVQGFIHPIDNTKGLPFEGRNPVVIISEEDPADLK